jgi:hypothetical protein
MKNGASWIVLGLLSLAVFVLTFVRTPAEITGMLETVSRDTRSYSTFMHLLFLAVIGLGLAVKSMRNTLFSFFIAYLSLSAAVVAVMYEIVPNVIVFGTFCVLILHAWFSKSLSFDFEHIAPVSMLFGALGLIFGFWYLHWVESPVWLNALVSSPLGVVNCPTMAAVCGFLCLSRKPRSTMLEATVALMTLYFGFFGIFRLGAYVDVALVVCALFLIMRLGARVPQRIADAL